MHVDTLSIYPSYLLYIVQNMIPSEENDDTMILDGKKMMNGGVKTESIIEDHNTILDGLIDLNDSEFMNSSESGGTDRSDKSNLAIDMTSSNNTHTLSFVLNS